MPIARLTAAAQTLPRLASLALALAWSPVVSAQDLTAQLGQLSKDVQGAEENITRLRTDLTGRQGALIGPLEATRRFQEATFQMWMKNYDTAAKEFFILLESGALEGTPEYRDSQWHLAECLFGLGSYVLAEEVYRTMIDAGPQHPFFAGSVRRMLEIYGITGDAEAFSDLYNRFILSNKVAPSSAIQYTLAKSFYRQKQYPRAKSQLSEIPPGDEYYTRARYYLGTILVVEGDYTSAIEEYRLVAAVVPETPEDRKVVDLANLALGRLYYEKGDFIASLTYYEKIRNSSDFFPDALYEMVWTSIKTEDYRQALQSVETFLLAFPEHQYTAQLKLLQGNLYMKEKRYEEALASYEEVAGEYTPVLSSIQGITRDPVAPKDWFRSLAATPDIERFYTEDLPLYAVRLLASDPEVDRALDLYREAERQQAEVRESEALITEIEAALAAGSGGSVSRSGAELSGLDFSVVQLQAQLLAAEEAWLRATAPESTQQKLDTLRAERELKAAELSGRGGTPGGPDRDAVNSELARLYANSRTELGALRAQSTDPNAAQVTANLDGLWRRLQAVQAQSAELRGRMGGLQTTELSTLRARLEVEKRVVADSKSRASTTLVEAEQLCADVTRAGFRELEETFAVSLLRADRGVVDVYWVEKVRVSEELKAVQADRSMLLQSLDAQFDVIRQGLPATGQAQE